MKSTSVGCLGSGASFGPRSVGGSTTSWRLTMIAGCESSRGELGEASSMRIRLQRGYRIRFWLISLVFFACGFVGRLIIDAQGDYASTYHLSIKWQYYCYLP